MFISSPSGLNHFYELYMVAKTRNDWATFHFRTEDGGYVTMDELASMRAEMDAKRYAQEFEASFETLQNRVYHAFDREHNVTRLDLRDGALLIGMDFNVNPMTAVIAQRAGNQCHVIDEIVLNNSNTQEMMQEINRRYPGRRGAVHPDPSGVARKTSAPVGKTDFHIIEEAGWPVCPTQPYPLVDRTNTVNARLCNAQGAPAIHFTEVYPFNKGVGRPHLQKRDQDPRQELRAGSHQRCARLFDNGCLPHDY